MTIIRTILFFKYKKKTVSFLKMQFIDKSSII